ncbi:MFS transporter [Chloroflexota bacterium]
MKHGFLNIYYGWWIVGASFLISVVIAGGFIYGFTTLVDPIAFELGWSYAQISIASSLRGLEIGLLAPLVGILTDRYGPKRIIIVGAIIGTTGLVILSRVTTLGMFYTAFFLIAIGTSGCTSTVMMTTAANWFKKNIGLAAGIVSCGMGFGGFMIPLLVKLIDIYDWRFTLIILAAIIIFVVLPLSLVIRHKPEQYGYLPDGETRLATEVNNAPIRVETTDPDFSIRNILKNSIFWKIALAYLLHLIVMSAVITHVMPYLGSIGISRSNAAIVATAVPVTSIVGRIGIGWLGDMVNKKLVAAGTFVVVSCGLLCFAFANNEEISLIILFVIFFGISYGGGLILRTSLIREYFFGSNFGTVYGFIMGVNILGAILGSPLAGWVYDNWGSYKSIWLIFSALPLISLALIMSIKKAKNVT